MTTRWLPHGLGLGDEAFTVAWDAGQVLAPEHAVTEALAVTAAPVSDTDR